MAKPSKGVTMLEDPAALSAELPPEVLAVLGDAEAPYTRPDEAEAALVAAVAQAPDNLALRIAIYTFYFYVQRLDKAIPHAEACLGMAARALGVPEDWRQVDHGSSDFTSFERPQRVYLKALVALGYCRARLGDLLRGEEMLRKAASLDADDRVGAARLATVVARGGIDDQDDEDTGG